MGLVTASLRNGAQFPVTNPGSCEDGYVATEMDNIPVFGKLITTFPVRVLAEAEYCQSSMESDDDKTKKIQKKNSSLNH
jgi:hypothetical protein